MKKSIFLGIAASFFFAFTFILNRSMHLSGGNWIWSASLRYLFTLPILALIVGKKYGFQHIHQVMKKDLLQWLIWSTVGFGLFYAPMTYASDYGESWLIAASWQLTIVMGVLMSPLFHKRISIKNLVAAGIILAGVFLLQISHTAGLNIHQVLVTLFPILIGAVSYPLGNRKVMEISTDQVSTVERTYGMTLCSLPFWILLSFLGLAKAGVPSGNQILQAFLVAILSGVAATLLFFKATDLVKADQRQLAVAESTQAGEVLFTLLGGILFLGDALPDRLGAIGILLILFGMVLNSLLSASNQKRKMK
ncbi:MAG: multidrug resistance efflux transporter family protein [Lachnospiraceae bacterium]